LESRIRDKKDADKSTQEQYTNQSRETEHTDKRGQFVRGNRRTDK
jgi:hypothetical protein